MSSKESVLDVLGALFSVVCLSIVLLMSTCAGTIFIKDTKITYEEEICRDE